MTEVTEVPELNLELMRDLAKRAEVEMTDAELEELMPAVTRNIERSRALLKRVRLDVEPAVGSPVAK